MYVANTELPNRIAESVRGLYTLLYNKYFVDEIYDATVVHPIVEGSTTVLWRGVDQGVIDGAVNGVGYQSRGIGSVLRLVQSGSIRSYATWVVLGSVAIIVVMGVIGRSF
jgi:NADH-quinone oxidoreductase subunit L